MMYDLCNRLQLRQTIVIKMKGTLVHHMEMVVLCRSKPRQLQPWSLTIVFSITQKKRRKLNITRFTYRERCVLINKQGISLLENKKSLRLHTLTTTQYIEFQLHLTSRHKSVTALFLLLIRQRTPLLLKLQFSNIFHSDIVSSNVPFLNIHKL